MYRAGTLDRDAPSRLPPLVAYVSASALIWAGITPVLDWVRGDLVGVGKSALEGAVMGVGCGLAMFAFETWLERRRSR